MGFCLLASVVAFLPGHRFMAARRWNRQFSVEEAARLVLEDESDDDDLDELLKEEELEDGGFSNASDSDDDMDGTSQKTSGSCSSRERSTVSPPAKRSKRTDRAILTFEPWQLQ